MENSFLHHLKKWNGRMNGLPRKALLIALTIGCAAVLFLVLPYCWPFLLGAGISALLEKAVTRLAMGFGRFRLPRPVGTLLGLGLLFGLVGAVGGRLIYRLSLELAGLVRSVPQLIDWMNRQVIPQLWALYEEFRLVIPEGLTALVSDSLSALGQSLLKGAGALSAALTSGAWSTAASIPHVLLSAVLTIASSYYLTADRPAIMTGLRKALPLSLRARLIFLKQHLFRALFGQVKSQLIISMVAMVFLTLAFIIYGVPYGFSLGIMIGVADALPVLGAGLFLLPWSIFCFLTGQTGMGIFLACAYVGVVVIRQLLEPRIVGRQLGLHPLLTMLALYAGYRLLGAIGLLAGPILMNVMKVVLAAESRGRDS